MLNTEEILIKIMQLLNFDFTDIKLKQTNIQKNFITKEQSRKKYSEHIFLIFKHLNLNNQNQYLVYVFTDLLFLYNNIYLKLVPYSNKTNEKKLNWIILKRLVIPFLAYRFASLDNNYDSRIDKNMSGGKFWYLPDVTDYNNVQMPLYYLMKWWLDLYGKGLDSLCNELDDKNQNEDKSISSKDTLKQWGKKSLPRRKSIEEYCSIELNYNGIFISQENISVDEEYNNALNFINNIKKISHDDLKLEIPYNSIVDKIFINPHEITDNEKKIFIKLIKERWAKPSTEKIKNNFLIARAMQDLYKRLINYFNFKDSNDIEENKMLQLIHLYNHLYNIQSNRLFSNDYSIDILDLGYEYLNPFNTDLESICDTIFGDISIELSNPKYSFTYIEDIYQIKRNLFLLHEDKRIVKVEEELKDFSEYFHKKYNYIDEILKKYDSMERNKILLDIENETDFQLFANIYQKYMYKDFEISEKATLRMNELASNDDEKQLYLSCILTLYTWPSYKHNADKHEKSKYFINELEKMLTKLNRHDKKENELLLIEAYFHLKSKKFSESLKYFDKYFNNYIYKQKKQLQDSLFLNFAAYCAYTSKNKSLLKKYNKLEW